MNWLDRYFSRYNGKNFGLERKNNYVEKRIGRCLKMEAFNRAFFYSKHGPKFKNWFGFLLVW